ncbi:MAG TPA: cytochrome c [Pseudolabrys sp.]|nr:cytochrome c [Pseudolabrys sp.]
MLRQALPIALITVAALAPLGAHADEKLTLKSVNVDLPFGDRMFPDGPGSEAVNNNCLACHSAGMVLTQPALSKEQWHAEVEKMRTAYKASIDPKDVETIVNYLVTIQRAK